MVLNAVLNVVPGIESCSESCSVWHLIVRCPRFNWLTGRRNFSYNFFYTLSDWVQRIDCSKIRK